MFLNSHISTYTRCLAEKVCGLVQSTWWISQGEDEFGTKDKILNIQSYPPPFANSDPLQSPPPRETVTSMFF